MSEGKVFKYRMFVQARTDLTPDEIRRYEATRGKNWPWRDTGEFIYARRRQNAKAFYRVLRKIPPIIKIKAQYESGRAIPGGLGGRSGELAMRVWRGFHGIMGSINAATDEVRHFPVDGGEIGKTACGVQFSEWHRSNGKPQCKECLGAAMERHPEMREFV